MNVSLALCLPREASTVSMARDVVARSLAAFGVTPACIEDICLAVSEACTNVIDHAAANDEYEVSLHVDEHRGEIRVTNKGSGFDAVGLTGELPDDGSVRGRGVAIMRAVMDQVDLRSEPERGTIVHLVKELSVVDDGPLDRMRRRSEPQLLD